MRYSAAAASFTSSIDPSAAGLTGFGSYARSAVGHDVIILHIHCEDVIPVLAFADESGLPPVLFLNHADHLFWLGTSVADLVLNLRDAATDITIGRRGVEADRNFLLPTIVAADDARLQSRAEAKAALGLQPIRSCCFPSREGRNTGPSTG